MQYVELHCKSNFSFLTAASHPDELVERASELGYRGLALTDESSVAGVVRGYAAAKDLDMQYIIGTEIHLTDAPSMVLWATDRASYGQMCRLISRGRMRTDKGNCQLAWQDVVEFSSGLLAGLIPPENESQLRDSRSKPLSRFLRTEFREVFHDSGYLFCEVHRGVDDQAHLQRLQKRHVHFQIPSLDKRI